jgi:hypothetical protein
VESVAEAAEDIEGFARLSSKMSVRLTPYVLKQNFGIALADYTVVGESSLPRWYTRIHLYAV